MAREIKTITSVVAPLPEGGRTRRHYLLLEGLGVVFLAEQQAASVIDELYWFRKNESKGSYGSYQFPWTNIITQNLLLPFS